MSDKEIAIRLVEKTGIPSNEFPTDRYLRFLDLIREHKSKTVIGKLEEVFYWFDNLSYYCEEDKNRFIDKVRTILEENK